MFGTWQILWPHFILSALMFLALFGLYRTARATQKDIRDLVNLLKK